MHAATRVVGGGVADLQQMRAHQHAPGRVDREALGRPDADFDGVASERAELRLVVEDDETGLGLARLVAELAQLRAEALDAGHETVAGPSSSVMKRMPLCSLSSSCGSRCSTWWSLPRSSTR